MAHMVWLPDVTHVLLSLQDVEVELLRRGEHKDVGPDWFFTVGTSMLVTMLLNLFMPHAWPLFMCVFRYVCRGVSTTALLSFVLHVPFMCVVCCSWGLKGFQRCCDRGCSNDYSRTRKMTQQSLEALYAAPRLARLSACMAGCDLCLCVCQVHWSKVLASGALRTALHVHFCHDDVLYWHAATVRHHNGVLCAYVRNLRGSCDCLYYCTPRAHWLWLVCRYWLDKYLLLTLYKSPPHYTDEFSNRARLLMPLAIVLHLGMAIWTLG